MWGVFLTQVSNSVAGKRLPATCGVYMLFILWWLSNTMEWSHHINVHFPNTLLFGHNSSVSPPPPPPPFLRLPPPHPAGLLHVLLFSNQRLTWKKKKKTSNSHALPHPSWIPAPLKLDSLSFNLDTLTCSCWFSLHFPFIIQSSKCWNHCFLPVFWH